MIKKTILILLGVILCFSSVYADTDLYLDHIGWCVGSEIKFNIYNKTDYENINEIERNLCDPIDKCDYYECELEKNWGKDQCDNCDNCLYFHKIKNPRVLIYDGPMESRPVIYNQTNSEGEFSFTFPTWNEYLIKVEIEEDSSGNKKQDYYNLETKIIIEECNTKFDEPEEEKNKYSNKNFTYLNSEILIEITNTTIENNSEISVRDDVIVPSKLNNTIKLVGITSKNKEFTKIDIKLKYPNNPNSEINLYKYDSKLNVWNEITNFKKENEYLTLESGELGIYSITEKENEIIEEPTITEPVIENNQTTQEKPTVENNQTIKAEVPANTKESAIETWQIFLLIGGISAIGIILYFKFKDNSPSHYHDNRNKEVKQVLTTYDQTYQETIKYVEKYKDSYSKDQLYRSLKNSGVPEDIINKVFTEKL